MELKGTMLNILWTFQEASLRAKGLKYLMMYTFKHYSLKNNYILIMVRNYDEMVAIVF